MSDTTNITAEQLDEESRKNDLLLRGPVQGAPEPGQATAFVLPPPPEPPKREPEPEGAPDFSDTIHNDGPTPAQEEEIRVKKWTKADTSLSLELFLNTRNMLQAEMLSMLAKSKDKSKYELDEDQLNMLAQVYAPYAERFGGVIPPWVYVLMTEAMTTGKLLIKAVNERRVNASNERAMKNPAVQNAARASAAQVQETVKRKRFEIDENGYYIKNLKGQYLKVDKRTEKADIKDIELIIFHSDEDNVKSAFPEIDLTPYQENE